jgi:periplasmic divalent cation tolerance protein
MKESAVIIQTTTNDKDIASKISYILLETKKIGCVHIQTVESHYHWNGKIVSDKEFVLSMKTLKSKSAEVISIIKSNHNYSLPEIIQINIDECSVEFLSWLIKETKQPVAH